MKKNFEATEKSVNDFYARTKVINVEITRFKFKLLNWMNYLLKFEIGKCRKIGKIKYNNRNKRGNILRWGGGGANVRTCRVYNVINILHEEKSPSKTIGKL